MIGFNLNFDVSLLFPLGIFLLVVGALFYYLYNKINVIESSLINQGKILQTFISGNLIPTTSEKNVPESNELNNSSISDKIDISDDEDLDESDDNLSDYSNDEFSKQRLNLEGNEENIENNNLLEEKGDSNLNIMNLGGESEVPTMEILANILQIESDESELNNSVIKSKRVLEDSDIIKVIDMESSTLEEISNENGELEETKKKTKSF